MSVKKKIMYAVMPLLLKWLGNKLQAKMAKAPYQKRR